MKKSIGIVGLFFFFGACSDPTLPPQQEIVLLPAQDASWQEKPSLEPTQDKRQEKEAEWNESFQEISLESVVVERFVEKKTLEKKAEPLPEKHILEEDPEHFAEKHVENTTSSPCPASMIWIPYLDSKKQSKPFCIDSFEVISQEKQNQQATGNSFSPYYPPTLSDAFKRFQYWENLRKTTGTALGKSLTLPPLSLWQQDTTRVSQSFAVSQKNTLPQGYLSGKWAEMLCKNAGKRLCSRAEWLFACKGPSNKLFPYGNGSQYVQGKCNIVRSEHPSILLHGKANQGHSDPRLNWISDSKGEPFLKKTAEMKECFVQWPSGKIHDMVGNLDEWVSDQKGIYGTFVGGFYSRNQKQGCNAAVTVHAFAYSDYSLGTRCCSEPTQP